MRFLFLIVGSVVFHSRYLFWILILRNWMVWIDMYLFLIRMHGVINQLKEFAFSFLFDDEWAMLKWLSICKRSIKVKVLCGLCKNNSWHCLMTGCSMAVDQFRPISRRNSWQFLWMFVLWVRTIAINLYISLFSLNPKGLFSGLKVSCAIKCAWDLLQVFYIVVICWFNQYHY